MVKDTTPASFNKANGHDLVMTPAKLAVPRQARVANLFLGDKLVLVTHTFIQVDDTGAASTEGGTKSLSST